MASKTEKTAAGLMIAGGLAAAVWSVASLGGGSDQPAQPVATQPDPKSATIVADTQTPAKTPALRHFNDAANSDYVLVCLRDTSLGQQDAMSDADKAKAAQYKADMVNVAKNLVADPSASPGLTDLFSKHTPVVFKIIAWDPSITKPDIGKLDIIPHQSKAGQTCPRDSSPVTKFTVP